MSQESTENIEKENINEENVSETQGIPTPELSVEEQLQEELSHLLTTLEMVIQMTLNTFIKQSKI